jgi:NAD-dependent SIR2 family protein deacetylase
MANDQEIPLERFKERALGECRSCKNEIWNKDSKKVDGKTIYQCENCGELTNKQISWFIYPS